MDIFFTKECGKNLKKICKNPSHEHLLTELYDFFQDKNSQEKWQTGYRISQGPNGGLFLKDRIEGSGGYRFYFLVTVSEEDVTISSFYPKKGKYSKDDLSTKEVKESLKSAIQSKTNCNRFQVNFDSENKKILLVEEEKVDESVGLKKN